MPSPNYIIPKNKPFIELREWAKQGEAAIGPLKDIKRDDKSTILAFEFGGAPMPLVKLALTTNDPYKNKTDFTPLFNNPKDAWDSGKKVTVMAYR